MEREAIKINSQYADAYIGLGGALAYKGQIDEAIIAYENFMRYAPPQYAGHVEKVKEIIKQIKGQKLYNNRSLLHG